MCQLTCVKIFSARPSNKDVSLYLAPFSEKVENHFTKWTDRQTWDVWQSARRARTSGPRHKCATPLIADSFKLAIYFQDKAHNLNVFPVDWILLFKQ